MALGILKHEIHVRPAWQVGRHDPDGCGIETDDDLIIPEEESDVPVLELIAWKKKKGGSSLPQSERARVSPVKLGRNDPCYCGSGKKYKKCHRR